MTQQGAGCQRNCDLSPKLVVAAFFRQLIESVKAILWNSIRTAALGLLSNYRRTAHPMLYRPGATG